MNASFFLLGFQDMSDLEFVIVEQIILDVGVDMNIRNEQNTVPLHVALARGAKSCAGLLQAAGANYNLQV